MGVRCLPASDKFGALKSWLTSSYRLIASFWGTISAEIVFVSQSKSRSDLA